MFLTQGPQCLRAPLQTPGFAAPHPRRTLLSIQSPASPVCWLLCVCAHAAQRCWGKRDNEPDVYLCTFVITTPGFLGFSTDAPVGSLWTASSSLPPSRRPSPFHTGSGPQAPPRGLRSGGRLASPCIVIPPFVPDQSDSHAQAPWAIPSCDKKQAASLSTSWRPFIKILHVKASQESNPHTPVLARYPPALPPVLPSIIVTAKPGGHSVAS